MYLTPNWCRSGGYANDPANRMSPTDEVKDNWYNSSEMRSNSSTYATANHPAIASYIGQNMDSAFQPIQPSRYILQPATAPAQARSQQGSGDEAVYETGQGKRQCLLGLVLAFELFSCYYVLFL